MYEYQMRKVGNCYIVDYLDIFMRNRKDSESRYLAMQDAYSKMLDAMIENEKKRKESQDEIRLKYIDIDPYGEENWEE